jgi:hypothetical protein
MPHIDIFYINYVNYVNKNTSSLESRPQDSVRRTVSFFKLLIFDLGELGVGLKIDWIVGSLESK